MSEEQGSDSVTAKRRRVTVAPSPFNAVKFELGVFLVALIPVWLLIEKLVADFDTQLLLLLAYSGTVSLWLLLRVRFVMRREMTRETKQDGA
ncbi:MAG: hypothetical protein HUJ29_11140 [Gammaproteobacteria bacterium]|nr:hypothetical protein [Gammaproteobacteria bacterium]